MTLRLPFSARTHLLLAVAFFTGSAGLTAAHVLHIRAMRDIGFPIAAEVQPLLQRKAILSEQADVAKLSASARGDVYREIYDVYVLPDQPDMPRVLRLLERLLNQLQHRGIVRTIDQMQTGAHASGASLPVSMILTVQPGRAGDVLDLIDVSGVLTVNDAFTAHEREQLLALTERENPAVIAAFEQFLGSDLLQYATMPEHVEAELFKAVGTEQFERDVRAVIDASRLRAFAQTVLLLDKDSWPLPLFTIERAHWEQTPVGERLTLDLLARAADDLLQR